MAKPEAKTRAFALRREGRSIKEIARHIGVSSGTVSIWVRDLSLTPAQARLLHKRQSDAGMKGRLAGAETNRRKKRYAQDRAKEEAEAKYQTLTREQLFYLGLGLYWGEGVKSETGSIAVVNSDPRVISLMMRWFSECLDVDPGRYMPRVFIAESHRDREELIRQFWVEKLGIPELQFRRIIFLPKTKKVYENRDVYYGVLALRVAKGNDIRHNILATIQRIAELGIPLPM
jgi:transposase-like protein